MYIRDITKDTVKFIFCLKKAPQNGNLVPRAFCHIGAEIFIPVAIWQRPLGQRCKNGASRTEIYSSCPPPPLGFLPLFHLFRMYLLKLNQQLIYMLLWLHVEI